MQWSLERIVPHELLGDNQRLNLIKRYIQKIKQERKSKKRRG